MVKFYKLIGLIGSIASIIGLISFFKSDKVTPPIQGSAIIEGNGNIVALDKSTISIKTGEEIKSYKGSVGPYSWEKDLTNYKDGEIFNDFMFRQVGKIVHLDIGLNEQQSTAMAEPYSTEKNTVTYLFHVNDNWANQHPPGTEYLITIYPGDDFYLAGRPADKHLSGYFKVLGISGPRQGTMSIALRPVNIEHVRK
ncbi:MAG: hypothetical protein HQL01_09580 [Nitrospirae bacterium]|nr:hypothetical protein [Nitrospirota bacterium]